MINEEEKAIITEEHSEEYFLGFECGLKVKEEQHKQALRQQAEEYENKYILVKKDSKIGKKIIEILEEMRRLKKRVRENETNK